MLIQYQVLPTLAPLVVAYCSLQAVRHSNNLCHWVVLFIAIGMVVIDTVFSLRSNHRRYGYYLIPATSVRQKVGSCFIIAAYVAFTALFIVAYSDPQERRDNIYEVKEELEELNVGTISEGIWYVPNVVINTSKLGTDFLDLAEEIATEISRLAELEKVDKEQSKKDMEISVEMFTERKDALQAEMDDTYAESVLLLVMGAIICVINLIGIKLAKGYILISPKDWAFIKSVYRKDK